MVAADKELFKSRKKMVMSPTPAEASPAHPLHSELITSINNDEDESHVSSLPCMETLRTGDVILFRSVIDEMILFEGEEPREGVIDHISNVSEEGGKIAYCITIVDGALTDLVCFDSFYPLYSTRVCKIEDKLTGPLVKDTKFIGREWKTLDQFKLIFNEKDIDGSSEPITIAKEAQRISKIMEEDDKFCDDLVDQVC